MQHANGEGDYSVVGGIGTAALLLYDMTGDVIDAQFDTHRLDRTSPDDDLAMP